MTSLTSMPVELYQIITSYVSHDSLFALALTSTTFQHYVTPMIYRFLYFLEEKDPRGPYLKQVDHLSECEKRLGRVSVIYQLPLFLRTIMESPIFRSYIQAADFQWHSDSHSDVQAHVSQILDLLPRDLKFLHLSMFQYEYSLPFTIPITSLQLHYPGGLGVGVWDGEFDLPFENVYSVFQIPTLRNLTYIDPRHLDHFPTEITLGARAKTSNITSLSFVGGAPIGEDFSEMMTWPASLKTFHMTLFIDEAHIGDRNVMSPERLREGLLPQRNSLEEIFIGGTWYSHSKDLTTLGYLQEFSGLKRLGVALDYLVPWPKGEGESDAAPDICQLLPSALEELQLEVPPGFHWSASIFQKKRVRNSKKRPHLTADGDELIQRLLEIAHHKEERFSALKTVVIFQTCFWEQRDKYIYPDVEEPPEVTQLFEIFEDAGIELYCGLYKDPPLFGIEGS